MEKWNGFIVKKFEFENREAIIAFPDDKPNGKWLLKMEYWNAFPNLEIEMLKLGWHIAYIRNITRWCLDEDIDLKARFVSFVSEQYGLEKKCIPIGMSCGGMFAVKFAAKYPSLVSALYLDAPVLNLLSCPAGIGMGRDEMWNEFHQATGITMSELICYREHPIDKIDVLIENNIPVVLVYGKDDQIVPYCENGAILEGQYIKNKKNIFTIGKENCGHHPHGVEDNLQIIEFLIKHTE